MDRHESARAPRLSTRAQRRALVLMNPAADKCSPAEIRASIAAGLDSRGWLSDVVEVTSLAQLDEEASRARSEDFAMVVVAGGNGTIARVAQQLAGTEIPLGIIPVGRTNSLSEDLGIPPDSDLAVALLAGEHEIGFLDALRVGDRHFFLQVGTAVPTAAAERVIGPEDKAQPPEPATLGAKVQRALGFESHRFTLLADDRHYRAGAWQVLVVNAGSEGSNLLASGPLIHPTDGAAELVVFQIRSFLDLIRSGFGLLSRSEERAIDISYHRIHHKVLIAPDQQMLVQGDGEAIGTTPVEITVVPKAVRVIVPPASDEAAANGLVSSVGKRHHRRRPEWFRSALLSRLGPVGALDTTLFVAVSRMPHPGPVNLLMQSLEVGMASGRGWILGTLLANLIRRRPAWQDLATLVPNLWIASLLTEYPIKEVFARPRPFASVVMTPVVGRKPSSHSFPSGHSASAFAGAWLLSRRHPRLSPGFYAFASLVSFSRVYQGVHYPSDVVIGAAAGTVLAAAYRAIFGDLIQRILRRT